MELFRIIYLFIYLVLTNLSSIDETNNLTQHLTYISVHYLFTDGTHILKLMKTLNELLRHVSMRVHHLQGEHKACS